MSIKIKREPRNASLRASGQASGSWEGKIIDEKENRVIKKMACVALFLQSQPFQSTKITIH
jgi:hypothetical protein